VTSGRVARRRRLPTLRSFRIGFNQDFFFERSRKIPPIPETPRPWFDVHDGDRIHLYLPKVDMGQGIHTALAQLAAEELDLPLSQLAVHQADLDRGFDPALFFTADSTSIRDLFGPLRRASARLRERIRIAASERLGSPPGEVELRDGRCFVRGDPGRSMSYADIARSAARVWSPSAEAVALKPAADFRYIGHRQTPIDAIAKVTGRTLYGSDARLPGMLYGAVARPPRYGARLSRARPGSAGDQPGVVAVVIDKGFAGIVADSPSAARMALDHLALDWEGGVTVSEADIRAEVAVPRAGGTVIQDDGDVSPFLASTIVGTTRITAEYRTAMVAHATLEGQAALVDVGPRRVRAYLSSQAPRDARRWIARATRRRERDIDVVPLALGGAFGRKGGHDVGAEAARLSAAVHAPVQVAWSLTDDLRHGWFRPPTHHVLTAALDDAGRLVAIQHVVASGDISFHFPELVPGRRLGIWLAGADPHASEGALVLYDVSNRRSIYHRAHISVPTSFFRSVGLFPSAFAAESFVDELAAAAGADPLDFRLRHLAADEIGSRLRAVLEAAGRAAGWGRSQTPVEASGVACCFYRGTAIALVAEIVRSGDGIRVRRVTAAVDPGLVINPDAVRAQVEGAVVMGIGSALFERASIVGGMLANDNLDRYRIMRMRDTPEIETVLVGDADVPLGGVGEIGMGPVGAAIGNAIYGLTGDRKRTIPFFPADAEGVPVHQASPRS
jgi:isoquinoline 1-oxidoreductase beta subunit